MRAAIGATFTINRLYRWRVSGYGDVGVPRYSGLDQQAADLMINLFANFAAGHSKSAALRNAQLKLIGDLKSSGVSPHPFYWAAFTMTGLPSREPSQPQPPVAAVQTDPAATVPGEQNLALPDRFIDLDQAIAKARELGMKLPPNDSRGFIDARLDPVRGETGKPNSATWTITAVEMGGAFPKPSEPVVLNASSGTETTVAELSGRKDLEELMQSLSEGKEFPANTPRDYTLYRKEADALAARWSKNLRLFQIDLMGVPQGKNFVFQSAEFRYFQPSKIANLTSRARSWPWTANGTCEQATMNLCTVRTNSPSLTN